ncbi:hypothetical protein [Methylocystis echinoides]|uniref:Uncharacterized protein n=1 Tax=Methylocystis echinoides TaxID=29468 RepID=A0A9W6GV42_9HYPH|nr:hypothetical protein [Methylocystis echinoides]GLI93673.1 hypothetical protein LMG27198_26650 [Methylocystis echinoides]
MARIRSVHPKIFTNGRFATLSIKARLLFFGLLTECWDDGVFEWEPIQLRMRLFPADKPRDVDVACLLAELQTAGFVMQWERDGVSLGAVRNFCADQRPVKPNSSGAIPQDVRLYVAFNRENKRENDQVRNQFKTGSEPVANQFETSSKPVSTGKGIGIGKGDTLRAGARESVSPGSRVQAPDLDNSGDDLPERVVAAWNAMAAETGLSKAERLTDPRRTRILARGKELVRLYGAPDPLAGFQGLFAKVAASPFLRGEASQWRASLDWVLQPANMTKILEGNYEQSSKPSGASVARMAAI